MSGMKRFLFVVWAGGVGRIEPTLKKRRRLKCSIKMGLKK